MPMQLKEIVLYNATGDVRRLPFRTGRVNIISGSSKTGKSALIDIVEYCLGASECTVPAGAIRNSVAWYGVLLAFPDREVFIARRDPGPRKRASSEVYVETAAQLAIPQADQLIANFTPDALTNFLTRVTGIAANRHEPPEGQTRAPLEATIRHALLLVFQAQNEIANRTLLFHRQSEPFVGQAIKDTLPYFLGAVSEDRLLQQQALRRERATVRQLERELRELELLRGSGLSKARQLLAEAQAAALLSADDAGGAGDDPIAMLRAIVAAGGQGGDDGGSVTAEARADTFTRLRAARVELADRYQRTREELAATRIFLRDQVGYAGEATAQRARLASVGLFEEPDVGETLCPVCDSGLDAPRPAAEQLRASITRLDAELTQMTEARPRVETVADELERAANALRDELRQTQRAIAAVVEQDRAIAARAGAEGERARVRTRIEFYLESVTETPEAGRPLRERLAEANERVAALEEELRQDSVQEMLASNLSVLSGEMTQSGRALELEYGRFPLRLDLSRLTVVADTTEGPIPMTRMGSGENWVAYHLIAHLALHAWFVRRKRPVPRFLFLDQPTQVYYPPERDADGRLDVLKDEDRIAVRRMFALIFRVVQELSPDLQVIITDHADIDDQQFQDAIVERWRGGAKLVPAAWLPADSAG